MKSFCSHSIYRTLFASAVLATAFTATSHAQVSSQSPATSDSSLPATTVSQDSTFEQATLLPDAPDAMLSASAGNASRGEIDPVDHHGSTAASAPVSRLQTTIEPGQIAPSLSAKDKVVYGLYDPVSIFSVAGWFIAAGYEQLINGSPNYGTDSGAFGERLGAEALRDTTETIFSESVMAPLLHEDPRYYRLGPTHKFFKRAVYSATRVLVTRTDSGGTSPNFALIIGNAAGAGLSNAYYPPVNQGFTQTLETFGTTMGSSALGNLVAEFYEDIIHFHHHH